MFFNSSTYSSLCILEWGLIMPTEAVMFPFMSNTGAPIPTASEMYSP